MRVYCTRYKKLHLLPPLCALLAQGAKIYHVRFEFGLDMTVKFYCDALWFAGIIGEKPILSKYILRCHMMHDSGQ